jgi:hypothetical protein
VGAGLPDPLESGSRSGVLAQGFSHLGLNDVVLGATTGGRLDQPAAALGRRAPMDNGSGLAENGHDLNQTPATPP